MSGKAWSKLSNLSSLLILAVALFVLPGAERADAAKYVMKYATSASDTHPTAPVADLFAKFVSEKSNGEMEVQVFRNASLGGDRQIAEGLQIGTIELGAISSSIITTFEPKMGIFDFPFLFKTREACYEALDGEVGQIIADFLLKKGLRVIGYSVNGYRHITNNKLPIHKPSDLAGLKIRLQENPIFIDMFKAFGASPTPMNFGELFTALQQRTVDAQENPIILIYSSRFFEVQKYISLTGHVIAVIPLLVSESYYQKLPKEYQEILDEAGKLYGREGRVSTMEKELEYISIMEKAGVEVNDLTPEEKDEFAELARPIYEKYIDVVGRDLFEKALAVGD
jgi:tripartite ATP-independent transporter DctP family solute receptor